MDETHRSASALDLNSPRLNNFGTKAARKFVKLTKPLILLELVKGIEPLQRGAASCSPVQLLAREKQGKGSVADSMFTKGQAIIVLRQFGLRKFRPESNEL